MGDKQKFLRNGTPDPKSSPSLDLSAPNFSLFRVGENGTNRTSIPSPDSSTKSHESSFNCSSSSMESTPSLVALERAISAQPGVSHREYPTNENDSSTAPPTLERAYTSSELLKIRANEISSSHGHLLEKPFSSSSTQTLLIERVSLPSSGIKHVEIDKNTHTVFSVEVRLQGRLQWVVEKRYSDFRDLHDRLKRTNATVKKLSFPKRHVFRSRHLSVIEQRRSDLEKYINEILEITPLLRVPLFNFLEVYSHMESYERKMIRHQKEAESERMKTLLSQDEIEDMKRSFKRLCSFKSMYQGDNLVKLERISESRGSLSAASSPKKPESTVLSPEPMVLVTRTSFRRDILGVFPEMPSSFAMRFMKAMCESSGSDVSIDEFLRAVAILKRGSAKDRLKFVFKMCDVDHTGKLQSSGLSNFLVTLHGRHILENVEYRRLVSEGFDHGHARLSLDEFLGVLVDKNASDILIDWMEHFADILCEQADPQLLETQEEYNPIVQQKILASESRFTIKEIALLQDAFIGYRFDHSDENTNTRIKATSNGDHIDLDSMMSDFPLDISEEKFVKAFSSFGPRANGVDIDIFSFVHALAIACRGTVEEKAKFAFLLFGSSDSDSKLTRDGLYDLLRLELFQNSALGDRVSKFILDSTDFSSNHSSPDKDKRKKSNIISVSLANLMNSTIGTSGSSVSKPKVTGTDLGRFVDHIILEYSSNSNKLSLDDFMRWSAAVGYEMLSLRIMREVAFVDLGLVPNSREEELYIANSCYKAFDPSEIVEDEHWYLVERKWFDHWCKYTQFQFDEVLPSSSSLVDISAKHSHSAPSNLSGAASGAALSSSSSSASKKDPPNVDSEGNYLRPRSINNDGLLTSQSLLTPDRKPNRVLKSSDDIKLGKHFAVVCDQLWFALKSWYGGGPEIKRTVVMRADGSGLLLDIWESEVLKEDKENEETDNEDTEGDIDVPRRSSSRKQLLCLQRRMRAGGSAGLVNLGNTCYMNSALQCLSSTQLLAEYFLSGMYLDDINRTSTLGLQGKLAEVYGKLIEDMWCAKQKAISPRDFKKTIAKFNEAFRGTEQQDAQELLAFLLSGLSEDLNRIHEKPYVEQPDSDGRFDGDLADEWWRNHLRREVSIIVALFTGQYKSLLTCSRCGFKSARFEPFTFLQVPLPEPTHTNVAILLVLANGLPPVRVSVRLSITATIYELKQELKKICNEYELGYQVAEMDIKIAEYSGSMILTFKSDSRRVAQIRSIDRLIAFQLEPLTHEIIKATRNRRPSYNVVSSSSGGMGMSFEDLEAEKVIQDHFLECLKPGMLVEIKSRSQSVDCLPGIVLDVLPSRTENRNNFAQQSQVAIRFKHGAGEMKVSLNRIRPRQPRLLYIPLVSRKLSYSALYFKNPFRPVAFGLPNLLRLCPELTTGYELYQMVWKRVHRFVSDNRKVVPPDVWIHSSAIDESLVCCKIDEVFASSPTLSSCGFVLRRVESKAQTDSRATWLSRSFGQTIPCTHEPLDVMEEETIAIDWDLNVFQDRDTQDKMKQIDSHYSLAKNETIDKGPVPLSHCIDAFTLEEKINEGYCSSCHEHVECSKKLEIWRLPPVMVIHLKRFQYTQTYRRKLGTLVQFPTEGLDLHSCVAPHVEVPQRYPNKKQEASEKESRTIDVNSPGLKARPIRNRSRRGYTNTNLDQGRCLETKYDLYGVVNHQGALGGGHYTAYTKSFVDNQWYYYDDERVRLVEESKVISSSAYLLFYLRSDMKGMMVNEMYPPNKKGKITDEDIDRFVEEGDERKCSLM